MLLERELALMSTSALAPVLVLTSFPTFVSMTVPLLVVTRGQALQPMSAVVMIRLLSQASVMLLGRESALMSASTVAPVLAPTPVPMLG